MIYHRISGRGFACMEQPAVWRHLVDVTVSLQAPSQYRTFIAMFRPGLCLKFLFYVVLLRPILL